MAHWRWMRRSLSPTRSAARSPRPMRAACIHRDVKSANILFDEDGNAFLSDFGIALEGSRHGRTGSCALPGSPAYASPEQLRREALGPASDVFSLGVVLFECLSGSLPFPADTPLDVLVDKQLTEPYPSLAEVRPDIPEDVLRLPSRRRPPRTQPDRFATVDAFVAALTAAVVAPASTGTPRATVAYEASRCGATQPVPGSARVR